MLTAGVDLRLDGSRDRSKATDALDQELFGHFACLMLTMGRMR